MSQTISLRFGGKNYSPSPFPKNFEDLEKEVSQLIKLDRSQFVFEYTHKDTDDDLAFGNDGGYEMAKTMGKSDKYGLIVKASRKGKSYSSSFVSGKVSVALEWRRRFDYCVWLLSRSFICAR